MRHLAMAIGLTEYFLGQAAPAVTEAAAEADRSDGDRLWGIARWAGRVARPGRAVKYRVVSGGTGGRRSG
ncbi:hypothetical protein ACIBKY_52465 [Nonomuraea sp. NPDC050394]|uniref:hypothetical protein n=1 Tax=Nonomuraea sp. NPDC050394 TaxID=3364363 RepID=UPI0037952EE7